MPASGPGKSSTRIGDHRQAKSREPRRITIGIENEPVALRLQPRDHAIEDGAAADLAHRLVAAAHPPRQTAGEQHAGTSPAISVVTVSPLRL